MTPAHVLVTGSTRGIGAAIRESLTRRGSWVAGHGRADGPETIGSDLAQPGAGDRLWDAALARLGGRIDVLINNAAVFESAPEDADGETWHAVWARALQINLQACADLSRRAVLHFRERRSGGRIVNIASRAAYRGDAPDQWHTAASKAGMVGVTKSIARGYAGEGILAFAVCPGFVRTGMTEDFLAGPQAARAVADIPLGRVATAEEVAAVATYLALDAPASMTGAVVDVNGASFVR